MKMNEYFLYYFIVRFCFILSASISGNYHYYSNQLQYILLSIKHKIFYVYFMLQFGYNYLKINFKHLYNKFFVCGFQRISSQLAIFTFLYKNQVTRIPLQINAYNNTPILKIEYKLQSQDCYTEDKKFTEYIKTFLNNRFSNVILNPKLLGFNSLLITTLDDECNDIKKEYLSDDIIE